MSSLFDVSSPVSPESQLAKRFREPIKSKKLTPAQCCHRHPWNYKAAIIELKNRHQGCFQCQFEDEIYQPGNKSGPDGGDEVSRKRSRGRKSKNNNNILEE